MGEDVTDYKHEDIEESEYSVKAGFSKAELVSKQIAKCLDLRSHDMRPGYTTYKDGKPEIVPDSRKEFIGAVEALNNMLAPEIHTEKSDIRTLWEAFKKDKHSQYDYRERTGRKFADDTRRDKAVWILSGRVFLPQKGTAILVSCGPPQGIQVSHSSTAWDAYIDAFWDDIQIGADELFAELNILIHNIGYFKGATTL
jgi:hypothetical protein